MASGEITVFDYGGGNLKSVFNAFGFLGFRTKASSVPRHAANAEKLVLPGVGAFGDCASALKKTGAASAIRDFILSGRPYLGICLGLQILFDSSEENPGEPGLGVFSGKSLKFPASDGFKVPHMGWNRVEINPGSRIFRGIENGSWLYFVHSFHVAVSDASMVAATSQHSAPFTAAVERGNVFACQFHPERSADAGLQVLRNFAEL